MARVAQGTAIRIATKSTMNVQTAIWDQYKRGTAAKPDLPYVYMEHVIFQL